MMEGKTKSQVGQDSCKKDDDLLEYIAESDAEGAEGSGRHDDGDKGGGGALRLWLRIWATPLAAWKAIRNSKVKPSAFETEVFYPILALVAAGSFARKFYFPDTSIAQCLIIATCTFVAFFASYFTLFPIVRILMRKDCSTRIDSDFGHCYVVSLLSTLAFFFFLYECLPFFETFLSFTPAYTLYLSYKGISVLRIPQQRRMSTWVVLVLLVIALPFLFYELMMLMLPSDIYI